MNENIRELTAMTGILEACKRGDRLAQRQLYEHFKGKMFVLCLRYADSREDAEDMLQEGFVKVFRDLPHYRGDGSLEGWIRKVILNVALQHIKTKKRAFSFEEFKGYEEVEEMADDGFFSEELVKRVLQLMQKMPSGFRTVLNLYILEGYTHAQIAREIGISEGTSKSQLNRAKKYLKDMLDKSLTD
ncbi:MAG TPA: sigma-70 family RNA polymerase sigma factor [Flavilitoribacter sp.]|nr:sigma-70 family RNA polymerase sigma factor [Flavilitoribacter sp.]HMQ87538.1 sigma-70 family RNA polymerase sigma factor [Flavilitoribacter sp.]